MGIPGLESARKFAVENPQYANWHFQGWRCQNGERIDEKKRDEMASMDLTKHVQ